MRGRRAHVAAELACRTRRGNLTRAVAEDELVVGHVADDGIALAPLAGQELLGQRVLDELLDRTAKRARAVGEVGALGHDLGVGRVRELDVHAVGDHALAQVVHEQVRDLGEVLARELLEDHDVVDTVEELGAEQALELAHRTAADLVCRETLLARGAKADTRILGDLAGADVRRHDDHRVAEIDRLALAVRETALLEHLQQDVEDVGVCLLDLIEEHHGVRMPAHGLGELAAFVVAHVSRGATDELGDLELAAELRHVEADERVLAAKEVLRERLGELRLAGARGAQEDEAAAGTARVLERRAAAAHGLGHGLDGLVLADDAGLEHALGLEQAAALALGERGHRHARGHGHDVGDLRHIDRDGARIELGRPGSLGLGERDLGLLLLVGELGGLVHVIAVGRRLDGGLEFGDVSLGLAHGLRRAIRGDAGTGAGLVDEIDRLIGQEAVLYVAVRQARGGLDGGRRVAHVVMLLVARDERRQDLDGVLDARLLDVDRLEAALEGGVLGEVLAELLGRGGADDLEGTAREHGLEHGARIDGALGGTGTDDGVHLIDEEDDVVGVGGLLDHVLEALLELAAILGAGDEAGQVERPDVLVHEVLGHVAGSNLLREALDDGRLAHARVAQDERVVLGAAAQDLHHALDFLLAADHRVELALARLLGEVRRVLLERVRAIALLLCGVAAAEERQPRAGTARAGTGHRTLLALVLGRELLDRLFDAGGGDAQAHEDVHGDAVALLDDADQQVLRRDVGLVVLARHAEGALHDGDDERREGELRGLRLLALGGHGGLDVLERVEDVVV